jgi:hypothetical protein
VNDDIEAPVGRYRFGDHIRRIRRDRTLRREADMMAFTVCLALLAALTAGNDLSPHSRSDVLLIVWGTTVALAFTHWFALALSMRLVHDPQFKYRPRDLLIAQLAMALVVAITTSVVVLALSSDYDRLGARISAAIFLGVLVCVESRAGGSSTRHAVSVGAIALVIAMSIATAKWFIGR